MQGKNEIRLNMATVEQAVQEYLDRRYRYDTAPAITASKLESTPSPGIVFTLEPKQEDQTDG